MLMNSPIVWVSFVLLQLPLFLLISWNTCPITAPSTRTFFNNIEELAITPSHHDHNSNHRNENRNLHRNKLSNNDDNTDSIIISINNSSAITTVSHHRRKFAPKRRAEENVDNPTTNNNSDDDDDDDEINQQQYQSSSSSQGHQSLQQPNVCKPLNYTKLVERQHTIGEVKLHMQSINTPASMVFLVGAAFAMLYLKVYERQSCQEDAIEAVGSLTFWLYAAIQYSVVTAMNNTALLYDAEVCALHVILHTIALMITCTSVGHERMDQCVYFVIALIETSNQLIKACAQNTQVALFFQFAADIILVIGHRWDKDTEFFVYLNSRLMYVVLGNLAIFAAASRAFSASC